jgi:hypothetical protein
MMGEVTADKQSLINALQDKIQGLEAQVKRADALGDAAYGYLWWKRKSTAPVLRKALANYRSASK